MGKQVRCETCGGVLNGDNTCTRCGLINGPVLVSTKPRFNPDERLPDREHLSYPTKNLGSDFIADDYKFRRLRRLNRRARGERRYRVPMVNLSKLCGWLGLPRSMREEAAYLYRRCRSKGTDCRLLCSAIVFIVCRRRGVPRTVGEILPLTNRLDRSRYSRGSASGIQARAFRKTVRRVSEELGLRVPPAKPEQYLDRFGHRLGLGKGELEEARRLLREIDQRGRSPVRIAAEVIYRASGLRETGGACSFSLSDCEKT